MSGKLPAKIFRSVNKVASAQILITTLILLMLISITVIVISVTVARNNKEVFNNLEYERSYNSAEGKLISVAEKLSDPKLDLSLITTTGSANPLGGLGGSCSQLNTSKYYCSFEEVEKDVTSGNKQVSAGSTRRTIVTIEESNEVIGYEIGSDEYFDVVLFKNKADSGYKGKLSIEWIGESGLELELISEKNNGTVQSIIEAVDNTGKIYTSTGSHKYGILKTQRITSPIGINIIEIDLNSAKVGTNAKLRYLRVRSANNQTGTALTIKPIQDTSLPKQVRRVEAFSYQSEGVESSAPVVITQLPLSPAVVSPLTKVASYTSIRNPVCGDGVVEGKEDCDDGNMIDGDSCANDCSRCNIAFAGDLTSWAFTVVPPFTNNWPKIKTTNLMQQSLNANNLNEVTTLVYFTGNPSANDTSAIIDFVNQGGDLIIHTDSEHYALYANKLANLFGFNVTSPFTEDGYAVREYLQPVNTDGNTSGLSYIMLTSSSQVSQGTGGVLSNMVKTSYCIYKGTVYSSFCYWYRIELTGGNKVDIILTTGFHMDYFGVYTPDVLKSNQEKVFVNSCN